MFGIPIDWATLIAVDLYAIVFIGAIGITYEAYLENGGLLNKWW